ncbi:sigma factor [Streptomyces hokutonensis]|uniref:sigma factor n=1 Tax=Streptomyces hokutonensis TaxID=1306990 RepID=UPI0036A06F35
MSSIDVVPEPGSSSAGTTGNATTSAVHSGPGAARDFESVRSLLFGIAHQRLGRAVDAEEVVQDVWVRRQDAELAQIRDRVALLVAVTTRAALGSARAGSWWNGCPPLNVPSLP